jgi:phosphoribosylformylglycinamidine cyclo-ligase
MSHYRRSGVDIPTKERAVLKLAERICPTWAARNVLLDLGYFANVVNVNGTGIAMTSDGVGSKVLVAQALNKYDTIGVDCVAMNVNDLLCVGATPISMTDYIAVERLDAEMIDALSLGLVEGARQANIAIIGGEISQIPDVIRGGRIGAGFDVVGTAIGVVDLGRIIIGDHIENNDVVIGIESNGIHSNGLSLARKVLLREGVLDRFFLEQLILPTHIYVQEVLEIIEKVPSIKALIHITGGGLRNLLRVKSMSSYVINNLPEPPEIFQDIQRIGHVPVCEMFNVFNMGIGFCIVADASDADDILSTVESHGKLGYVIGYTVNDGRSRVDISEYDTISDGREFKKK